MDGLEGRLAALRDKAKSLHQQRRFAESLDAHEEALRLAPDAMVIRLSAARLAHSLEMQEVSLRHYEEAVRVDPRCYDAMLAAPPQLESPAGTVGVSAFFLAYHGRSDRQLQEKTARLYLAAIPSLAFVAPHCADRSGRRAGTDRAGAKIRIGFISRFFASHSIFSTSIGLIEKLSRERFEVVALRITPSRDDAATARVRAAADLTVNLDPDLYRAREQIAALELDILFYQDIGMEPISFFLAFARLAPVQCVSFGHPNTTGIPTMDYFISNDLFEPPQPEAHYSERLILLRDLPTLAYYYRPKLPPGAPDRAAPDVSGRAAFGLPLEAHLYVCPQTLFKLHPDFDAMLAGILDRDPKGLVVLIAGQFQEFTDRLRARFARALPAHAHRIVFLPFMPLERFMQLLCVADVILDTPHFNGMNSSLQAFAAGTPVVTLPGELQRGRHTQAMYRKMGILDCIAAGPGDYVDIAVRIAADPAHAQALRRRILARNHVLFEDPRVVEEFERFFTGACGDGR